MSKEQLGAIIKSLPYSIRHEGNVEALIEFAKGQAEQVRKLEVRVQELIEGINFNNEEYGKVEVENERYRELLESIRYTQDVAKEIQVEKPNIKVITPDDLLQHILRKVNKELEKTENA